MFKKTLIAAALASASLGATAASTVGVTSQTVTTEYADLVGSLEAGVVSITPSIDYSTGSVVTIRLAGATFVTEDADGDDIVPTVMATPAGDSQGIIEFLQYNEAGTEAQFLVSSEVNSGETDTVLDYSTFAVSGLVVNTTGLANEDEVDVTSLAIVETVVGIVERDESDAATLFSAADQLSTAIDTAFDATIDVEESRQEFTDGTTDTLVFEHTNNAADNAVDVDEVTYTVYGDFSFLDVDGDGELGGDDDGSLSFSLAETSLTIADDFMSVVIVDEAFPDGATAGLTVTVPGDVTIPDQSFQAKVDVEYSSADTDAEGDATVLAMGSAGSWVLNGAQVHVPFLPFFSTFSQSVTVSNTSNQTGGVDLVVYVGGDETVEINDIATVDANGVTDISTAIRNAVAAAGLNNRSLAFDVIVNAPEDAIQVVAVYYSIEDADRLRTK